MLNTLKYLSLVSLVFGTSAFAQSPYEFSGSGCTTHGTWTQNALSETQGIAQTISNLMNNDKCRGLGESLSALQVASRQIQDADAVGKANGDSNASQNEQDTKDLNLIKDNLITQDGTIDASTSGDFLTKFLKVARNSSFVPAALSVAFPASGIGTVNSFAKMFNRSAFVAEQGMNALTTVMKVVPNYTECLMGHSNEGVLLMSGLVKMTASLSSSGGGTNHAIGNALAGLAEMMAKEGFAKELRKADEITFNNSVSCLMETVSQHWCEVENAQHIMDYFHNERAHEMRRQEESKTMGAISRTNGKELPLFRNNPLNGYYMLTRELPIITEWMQKVQIGSKPRLYTDAEYQNKVIDNTNNLIKLTKTIQGQYSEDMQVLSTLTAVEMQRNQLFNALNRLAGALTGGGDPAGGGATEFITNSVNSQLIPYKLIGMDSLPDEATGSASNMVIWQSWMQKNKKYNNGYIPQFNDPIALSKTIESRMNDILDSAAKNASAYYQNFLIVDQINLVNDTSSGPSLTVRGAFQNIYLYLSSLEKDFRLSGQSPATLGSILDLKQRIRVFTGVFTKYEAVVADLDTQFNATFKIKDPTARKAAVNGIQISKQLEKAAADVIDTTFDVFKILKGKDSFVSNRMRTLIQMDLKNRIEESKTNKLTATILSNSQKMLLNYTLKVIGDDPTLSTLDLAQAKVAESKNLEIVSKTFRDTLYAMILEQKSHTDSWTGTEYAQHLRRKMAADAPHSIKNMLLPFLAWMDGKSTHPDLYSDLQHSYKGRHIDDTHGSAKTTRALYCALSLSMNNRSFFMDVCKGAVLPSFFDSKRDDLNLSYSDRLPNREQAHKIATTPALYTSTVCSFNRYLAYNRLAFIKDQERNATEAEPSDRADAAEDLYDRSDAEAVSKN